MKKMVLALVFVMITSQFSIAQGVEPTYEKQDDLDDIEIEINEEQ